jgi:isopenicillin N synthase-like dioxygenase
MLLNRTMLKSSAIKLNHLNCLSSNLNKSFSQNIVRIPYQDLINKDKQKDLFKLIEEAYGKDGLGLLVVEKVPNWLEKKNKFFTLINDLVHLPPSVLKSLERPDLKYSLGWSYGKEYFNDKPDLLKASYYAQLLQNSAKNPIDHNLWPKELPELSKSFFECGSMIRDNGIILLNVIDKYIQSVYPKYNLDYPQIINDSKENTGRMLYYHPRKYAKDQNMYQDNWCEWHNDHGSLTGLASSIYVDEKGNEANIKLSHTGLYIQTRKGETVRAPFGKDDIAYQVGETLQIHSGGILNATPHAVKVMDDIPDDIARITFALFMEPNKDFKLQIPQGSKIENVKTAEVYKVPKLQDRFKEGMTFGEFCEATYSQFYK